MNARAGFGLGNLLLFLACGCGSDENQAAARPARTDGGAADDGGLDAAPDAAPDLNLLRSPREAEDLDPDPNVVHVRLVAAPATHTIGEQQIPGFAYNGQTPGPTLRAKVGDLLRIDFENQLDEATTIHWHGANVPYAMDGVTWQTNPIEPGATFTYSFKLTHAGTFWYHPHFNSNGQVDRGLYGVLVVEDPAEPAIDDLIVVFDVWGEGDGPSGHVAAGASMDAGGHEPTPGSAAQPQWTVNGLIGPRAVLRGGSAVRVRLLNVSTRSYLDLRWPRIRQIGSDQGLLPALAEPAAIVLAPGDRAEAEWLLGDQGFDVETAPYSLNGGAAQGPLAKALSVEVTEPAAAATAPDWPFSGRAPTPDRGTTDIVYVFTGDPYTNDWRINGEQFPNVTVEELKLNADAVIEVRNSSPTEHPFHLHGHAFEVLSVDGVAPQTRTFEDTFNVGIRGRVRVRLLADNPGDWMAHCHILDHADHGMMTVLRVLSP